MLRLGSLYHWICVCAEGSLHIVLESTKLTRGQGWQRLMFIFFIFFLFKNKTLYFFLKMFQICFKQYYKKTCLKYI